MFDQTSVATTMGGQIALNQAGFMIDWDAETPDHVLVSIPSGDDPDRWDCVAEVPVDALRVFANAVVEARAEVEEAENV